MLVTKTDVLIVGAGPSGLTLSALLATYGVSAITITRYASTAHSPRAHITNQRTVEVFRDLGIENRVVAAATHSDLMSNNVWATSFAGQEIARLQSWGTGVGRKAEYEAASPCHMCNAPQHILEPVIREAAEEFGADIRFSTELVSITQDDAGVTAIVRHRETGVTETIRAAYAVGADGARSTVAEQLEFEMTGEEGLGAALNIWLEADLTKFCAYRPGVLYWMAQPGNDYWVGSGTWINVKPFTEWVLLTMYDPSEGEPPTDDESLIARAQSTIGDPSVTVKIKSVSKWQINHMVAKSYQKGRVFLSGDAAHRHPPANGLGSNTSIQDAFNLAWKLAYVCRGTAEPALLDSYTEERQPVGQFVVDRALKSVQDMAPISKALGFRPGQSSDDGWASLAELFSPSARGEVRRAELSAAVDLQNYQFNALGVELGQHYASRAVVDDGSPVSTTESDAQLHYQASTTPGSPLPHVWLQRGQEKVSSLDTVGRGRFTLITGIDDTEWRRGVESLCEEFELELPIVQIGPRAAFDDVLGDWARISGLSDSGALLVRPDRFVAWRERSATTSSLDSLRTAIETVLGRSL